MACAGRLDGTLGVGGPRTPEAASAANVDGSRGAENTFAQSWGTAGWAVGWFERSAVRGTADNGDGVW